METLEFEYYHVTTDDPFILSPRSPPRISTRTAEDLDSHPPPKLVSNPLQVLMRVQCECL